MGGQGNTPGCGELSSGLWYQGVGGNTSPLEPALGQAGNKPENRDDPQLTWLPDYKAGRFNARQGVGTHLHGYLRYGLRPPERVRPSTGLHGAEKWPGHPPMWQMVGITELACGSQAFIATLLFDPSMSALPIIPKQNSVSVGLFTH